MYGNILQIMAAQPAWEAVYGVPKEAKVKDSYMMRPLNCWALVEFKGTGQPATETIVVGMVAIEGSQVLDFVDEADEVFLGYNYPGCTTNWHKRAMEVRNK